jgi:hypothetical protein
MSRLLSQKKPTEGIDMTGKNLPLRSIVPWQMPRVVQLIGHDHFSSNPSIGTQDTQLSAEILQLIRSTAGAYQPMTAR